MFKVEEDYTIHHMQVLVGSVPLPKCYATLNGGAACRARKAGELLGNGYERSTFIHCLP